jgi:hypothetical protein
MERMGDVLMKNKFSLMADRIPGYNFPISRDWEDIDCNATTCLWNKNKKCTVPSTAKIGENGRCLGYKCYIESLENKK